MTSMVQSTNLMLERIRQRGYWRVIIHPAEFQADRIPRDALLPLIQKSAVQARSWGIPRIHDSEHCEIGPDWVQGSSGNTSLPESWRLYQSGQFVYYAGLAEDWRGRSFASPNAAVWQPGQELAIAHSVHRYTACFELAKRLAFAQIFPSVHIEITFHGLQQRQLRVDSPRQLSLLHAYHASTDVVQYAGDIATIDLIAGAHREALNAVEQLFQSFQWQPAPLLLQDLQREYLLG
jgi:hypothetical protein